MEAELTWKQWTDKDGIQLTIVRGNIAQAIKELDKRFPISRFIVTLNKFKKTILKISFLI